MQKEQMSISELLMYYKRALSLKYSEPEIKQQFSILMKHVVGFSKEQWLSRGAELLDKEPLSNMMLALDRLNNWEPIQYIIGNTEFLDLTFDVSADVLIPRPETEELVLLVDAFVKERNCKHILDIGTGSGCIPISLKYRNPNCLVSAIDISEGALRIAKGNATKYSTDVIFFLKDILSDDLAELPQFDLIVSNPPYVLEKEKSLMSNNVLNFEPVTALFVPDQSPLLFYNRIAEIALRKLSAKGALFFEINENFGNETCEMLACKGFVEVALIQDLFGKDRFVKAIL